MPRMSRTPRPFESPPPSHVDPATQSTSDARSQPTSGSTATARSQPTSGSAPQSRAVSSARTFAPRIATALVAALALGAAVVAATVAPAAMLAQNATHIRDIQGDCHTSPMVGTAVADVPGIVTVVRRDHIYVQDPAPDRRVSTSEGIRVMLPDATSDGIDPGDEVAMSGTVREVVDADAECCPVTQLDDVDVRVLSSGNELPAPIVVGEGGRVPPSEVIDDDGNTVCNPTVDGLDFWESLEHMRVQVNEPLVVGASKGGDVVVVGDRGRQATGLSARGALTIAADDFNPERLHIDPLNQNLPRLWVGDRLDGSVVGVVTPVDTHWELMATSRLTPVSEHQAAMRVPAAGAGTLSVASFNVKNLNVTQVPQRFLDLAAIIVDNLAAPDLVALQEIQDDNGPGDDGSKRVSARLTLDTLVGAIEEVGGPTYTWHQIDPKYGNDGGAIVSNIRTAFLVRGDGPLRLVERGQPDATTATRVLAPEPGEGSDPRLSLSPGRIEPTNSAFRTSRKPLAAELRWGNRTLFAINVHYNARLSNDPLLCCTQPPVLHSEERRVEQGRAVQRFVAELMAVDEQALVVVLGDFNTFDFAPGTVATAGDTLINLADELDVRERYSYIYLGNAQMIDHMLVSPALREFATTFGVVHVNAEQPAVVQASDHDPLLARFALSAGPVEPPPAPSATPRPAPPTRRPPSTAVPTPRFTLHTRILLPYTSADHDLGRRAPLRTPTAEATATPTLRPTPRPSAEPTAAPPPSARGLRIAYLECGGRDELVLLRHAGGPAIDLAGWQLVSVLGNQRLDFSAGVMRVDDELEIHSGPDAPPDATGVIRWRRSYVWTDEDVAELRDPSGERVDRLACGEEVVEP